jgi:hypothetical protein
MRDLSAANRIPPPQRDGGADSRHAPTQDGLIALVRGLGRQAAREEFRAAIKDPVKPEASMGGAP